MDARWQLDTLVKGGPVHDGDSFHVVGVLSLSSTVDIPGYDGSVLTVDYGVHEMVRVAHCNAAELNTDLGKQARTLVMSWFLRVPANLPLITYGRDKYKRLLADVILSDGSKLSDFILTLPGSVPMELHLQLDS